LKPEINRRAGDALVSHEIANRFDSDFTVEKAHGEGMSEAIGKFL
jgi:hypothetical protein